jgi:hypothetical protein
MPDETPVLPAQSVAAPVVPPVAPAAVVIPSVPVAVAPAAPPAEQTPPPAGQPEPTWLKSRLDQARRNERTALMAELGVKDPDAAKAAIAAAAAAAEAEKTAATRLTERDAALTTTTARLSSLEQVVKARADSELASLTEAQRAAVAAVAGEDSARALAVIDALKPTWAVATVTPAAVTPAPAVTAAIPAVVVPPATTTPPPVAPGGAAGSPPDRKAEYAALKAKSAVAASAYLNRYESEIFPRA